MEIKCFERFPILSAFWVLKFLPSQPKIINISGTLTIFTTPTNIFKNHDNSVFCENTGLAEIKFFFMPADGAQKVVWELHPASWTYYA